MPNTNPKNPRAILVGLVLVLLLALPIIGLVNVIRHPVTSPTHYKNASGAPYTPYNSSNPTARTQIVTTPSRGFSGVGTSPLAGSTQVLDPTLPIGVKTASLGFLYSSVTNHQVSAVTIDPTQDLAFFSLGKVHYAAAYLDPSGSSVSAFLLAHNVNVTIGQVTGPYPTGSSSFPWFYSMLVVMALLALAVRIITRRNKAQDLKNLPNGDTMTLDAAKKGPGATHGSLVQAEIPDVTFQDVAGVEEATFLLAEFVQFLTDPTPFDAVGASIPKGALLTGPPGTGKTLLARAVAGEAKVPFFAASGADFAEIYVGTGPKRVRELFAKARLAGPSILFIDEIDAIAKRRSNGAHAGDSERESTLIALLNEMDGFRKSNVVVIAATNRPDVLDPALTRPGRLDRRIEVPLPDRRGREHILRIHALTRPVAPNVDFEAIARRTSSMSGADLAQVVNEAAIEAARARLGEITPAHFDAAIATVAMGRARTSALVTDHDRLVTAWHEAGHTVCAYVQDAADKPVSVSIIPRGPAGGVTWMSEGDEIFMQRSKASARLVTALGGRAAEELLLGEDYTQGAYGDLSTATELAFSMATRYGMTSLGLMVRDPEKFGSSVNDGVLPVVEDLLSGALDAARAILVSHRDFMDHLVAALLEEDTLNAKDIERIYRAVSTPGAASPRAILDSQCVSRVAPTTPAAPRVPVHTTILGPAFNHTPTPTPSFLERVGSWVSSLGRRARSHPTPDPS